MFVNTYVIMTVVPMSAVPKLFLVVFLTHRTAVAFVVGVGGGCTKVLKEFSLQRSQRNFL